MKQAAKIMDRNAVQNVTVRQRSVLHEFIQSAQKAEYDDDRMERLKLSLCRFCHYLGSRIGGAAMTERDCGVCGTSMMYGSTCTDALCLNCAREHELCKHCGADRELRPHRRKFAWIKTTSVAKIINTATMFILPKRSEEPA